MKPPFSFHGAEAEKTLGAATSQESLRGRALDLLRQRAQTLVANPAHLCVSRNVLVVLFQTAWNDVMTDKLAVNGKYGPLTHRALASLIPTAPKPCTAYGSSGSHGPLPAPPRAPPYTSMTRNVLHGPKRSLGDAVSAATDAQMQMVGLASFFAGVNAGQAPNPTQLAAAMTAVQNMQNDLVAMGATAPSANTVGGVTKLQAAGIGVGSALLGVLIDRAVK